MARDGGGGSPGAERRRVALRALLASGGQAEAESARAPGKGLLRGLRCTSAAASQAIAPETPRPPADWRGLGCAAASQAHAPEAARPTADWRGLGCASAAAQAHAPVGTPRRSEEWRRRRRRNGRERRTCGARRGYRSPPRPPRWTAWWRRTRRWARAAAPRPTGRAGRYALALPLSLCSLRIRSWMQDSASIRSY